MWLACTFVHHVPLQCCLLMLALSLADDRHGAVLLRRGLIDRCVRSIVDVAKHPCIIMLISVLRAGFEVRMLLDAVADLPHC